MQKIFVVERDSIELEKVALFFQYCLMPIQRYSLVNLNSGLVIPSSTGCVHCHRNATTIVSQSVIFAFIFRNAMCQKQSSG